LASNGDTPTKINASPFSRSTDNNHIRINITALSFEEYPKNVVISAITLNDLSSPVWVETLPVHYVIDIYSFNQKVQFYAPYAACFITTLLIYADGIYSLARNGNAADSTLLQIVATTIVSATLRSEAANCSRAGTKGFSHELETMELIYGGHRQAAPRDRGVMDSSSLEQDQDVVLGFGTVDEVQRLA
jgi:hypothetical protein